MSSKKTAEKDDGKLVLLGIKMPKDLKTRIEMAAALEERRMSDWARLTLKKAANAVLAEHDSQANTENLLGQRYTPELLESPPAKAKKRQA